MVFAWEWEGPELDWTLTVVDANLETVFEKPGVAQREIVISRADVGLLFPEDVYYWYVSGASEGGPVRSSPMLFRPGS